MICSEPEYRRPFVREACIPKRAKSCDRLATPSLSLVPMTFPGSPMCRQAGRGSGFTLIETAVALAVIGIVMAGIIYGSAAYIQSARTQAALSIASDLSVASREFRQRYHFLPGDFPVTQATPEITGLPARCMVSGANAGNGNGVIDATESPCVPEHLAHANFIKATIDPATGFLAVRSAYGPVRLIANAASNVALGTNPLPSTVLNVIEFAALPCEVAQEIDRKIDDANLATGNVRASLAACTPRNTSSDPVPFLAFQL